MARPSSLAHIAYLVTIIVKGLFGLLEFLAGTVIAITGPQRIYAIVLHLTAPELYDERRGHAARMIRHGAEMLAQSQSHFVIFYLLVHGSLKMAITIVLLRGHGAWMFPVASAILLGFIGYFCHELSRHWSNWILGLALFDGLTLALVVNEWRNWKKA